MLKHTLAASLLACAALTPVAYAQDAKPQQERSAKAGSVNFIRDLQGEQFRSTNLVGKTVYNQQDENIGSIGDLILDKSGRVAGVVIDVGGFLGIGANEVAVPMNALRFEADSDAMASSGTDASNAAEGRAATEANVEKQPGAAGSPSGTSTSAALPNQNTKDQGSAQENAAASADQAKQAPQSGAASGSRTNLATSDSAGSATNESADAARADEDTLANIKIVLNTSRDDLENAPKFGEAAN